MLLRPVPVQDRVQGSGKAVCVTPTVNLLPGAQHIPAQWTAVWHAWQGQLTLCLAGPLRWGLAAVCQSQACVADH